MLAELRIECGPHPRKRHGSECATVARAQVIRTERFPDTVVELFGVVEQRLYRRGELETWEEYVTPVNPGLASEAARGRKHFDEHWEYTDPVEFEPDDSWFIEVLGIDPPPLPGAMATEFRVRERSLLRCPVCQETLPVGNAEELRSIIVFLTDRGVSSITLAGLRRARELHKRAEGGTLR